MTATVKIPSEKEVAPRYKLLTLFILFTLLTQFKGQNFLGVCVIFRVE